MEARRIIALLHANKQSHCTNDDANNKAAVPVTTQITEAVSCAISIELCCKHYFFAFPLENNLCVVYSSLYLNCIVISVHRLIVPVII
jgi:hypothetical protein